MNQTEERKNDHIKISLEENISADYNQWDDVELVHNALPEINKEEIDLSTRLLNKKLGAPLVISGMTGGYKKAKKINKNLAIVAEKYQLGMGVGSQRSALENKRLKDTYSIVKKFDIPLRFANIGASQLVLWDDKELIKNAQEMIDMIDADVFAVCLNFLQEVIQLEGEANAKGCYKAIENLVENLDVPVMVKETGAGISYEVAEKLSKIGVSAIDVGGAGGTSFAAIEHYRAKQQKDDLHARGGRTFWNWGIPTPTSLIETGDATNWEIPIIATGGIRNGLDAAKAIALGAKSAGLAYKLLKPATRSEEETISEMDAIYKELRASMFLTGAANVSQLRDIGAELWI